LIRNVLGHEWLRCGALPAEFDEGKSMSEDSSQSQSADSVTSRRAFVRTVGAVGAAGLALEGVVGCAGPGASSSGTGSGSAQRQNGGTPAAVADPAPTGPSQLGSVTDIAVGGGKVFTSPPLVVTHPAAGQFKAFSGVCTHTGCKLSEVKAGEIICPCHGSRFSAATGAVVKGPATESLPPVPITVENGVARVV
jgi:Rieske Fe-S protein